MPEISLVSSLPSGLRQSWMQIKLLFWIRQVVGVGKHEELLQVCKVYQEIYHSQMGKKDA